MKHLKLMINLDFKELQLLASYKKIGSLLETTADYENTIVQFRESMQILQRYVKLSLF